MKFYRSSHKGKTSIPLKTSVSIDPLNRAGNTANRSASESSKEFERTINLAIENYKKAIALDPENIISYNNIASAYLLLAKPYKAISFLQDAEKIQANHPLTLNNMGVAFYMAKNSEQALAYLNKAKTIGRTSGYVTPLYNLGVIAYLQGDEDDAEKIWKAYLIKDSASIWADVIRKTQGQSTVTSTTAITNREKLSGIEIGTYHEEIPAGWKNRKTKDIKLGSAPIKLTRYSNGITTLTESGEIRVLTTQRTFKGKSSRGIQVGQDVSEVIAKYGYPEKSYLNARGKFISYLSNGISFQLESNKVKGWVLFWE